LRSIGRSGVIASLTFSMISVWVMNNPRFSFLKKDLSAMHRPSRITRGDGCLDHGLVDGQNARAGVGRIEFEIANHAAESLAQRARAEALLPRGVPGDGDQRAAGDLQVDAEALEERPRGAEDRLLRLDEDTRQVAFGEVVQHDDRLEARDELRRHAVAKEIV